jgi:hypothetical protein
MVLQGAAILFRFRKVYPDQDIGYPGQDYGRLVPSTRAGYWNKYST